MSQVLLITIYTARLKGEVLMQKLLREKLLVGRWTRATPSSDHDKNGELRIWCKEIVTHHRTQLIELIQVKREADGRASKSYAASPFISFSERVEGTLSPLPVDTVSRRDGRVTSRIIKDCVVVSHL